MESLLNGVWIATAVIAFAVASLRIRDRRLLLRTLLVLGCALAVLFPVVSLSDDLASDLDVWGSDHHTPVAELAVVLTLIVLVVAIGRIDADVVSPQLALLTIHTDPRSPPRR